jgi:S-methylmethionine-dependent homocysteine/selenocysteine methylase
MKQLLKAHDLILMEAAVVERLRRNCNIELHPKLVHAGFVSSEPGRQALKDVYQSYVDVAREARMPILLCAPTWRASRERVRQAGVSREINAQAVDFMSTFRSTGETPVRIGGIIGCRNDCYQPEEALSPAESEDFHSWQIERLAEAGVDFLLASTLPEVDEAKGIARAMSLTRVPYLISFVINSNACVLDGTPLYEAVSLVDESVSDKPLGFMVNCSHPSFLDPALQPRSLFQRLVGFQGNASSMDQADLDGQANVQVDDVSEWARAMLVLNERYGVKILGGCCGTGVDHLRGLVALRGEGQPE